jgi:hypothetical protein
MKGIGFIQCPFDKTVFIKWFESQERFLNFWQHVDDRWGHCEYRKQMAVEEAQV